MRRRQSLLDIVRIANPKAYANASLNLIEGFLRTPKPISYPVNLDIILTKACNLRCVFCISYGSLREERWMSFPLYERISRSLFPYAHGIFICSGGEPFLYPRIRKALRLARDARTLVTVVTNGTLLNRETADWLVEEQSVHELCVSFDAATKSTLESIRRGANYETILENVAYLAFRKEKRGSIYPRMRFRYSLMSSNAEEFPAVFDLAARKGLYRVTARYVNVANDIEFEESLYHHPELAKTILDNARRKAAELGIRADLPPPPDKPQSGRRCVAPWRFVQIDTDGAIRFCYPSWRQRLGFFTEDFDSIWRGEHYQRIRKTIDSDKPYFPYCDYCSVRNGVQKEESHNQKLKEDAYVIPGLEQWQIPFNQRIEENKASFRERRGSSRAKS